MKKIAFVFSFLFLILSFVEIPLKKENKNDFNQKNVPKQEIPKQNISEYNPGYQDYENIIRTLKKWESEAPDLLEVNTYGKSTKDKDLYYIKISNEKNPSNKKVLITSCIHGNEPWSTSTMMVCVWKIISSYGKDQNLTNLLNNRTLYFIPVISPDSYPISRYVDGVDPNRNFPTKNNPNKESVLPIKKLQEFFIDIKPNSVLSGHTYGRVFLIPWGDSIKNNINHDDYERIAKEMSNLSNYKYKKASELYNRPIFGTETDWYHRNGAFAMVMEFGSHQKKPSRQETIDEFNRTFSSIIYFIEKSPDVKIQSFH